MQLAAVLIPAAEVGFVALNPETGTTTQGESIEEALANLQEATELYLEEFSVTSYGKPLLTTFEVSADAA
ncbi:MAG: HicB family protein [Gammaproteobacteria bacterium HGW-Gammaproteobacteria-4]|jgi:predicted RNase H-like HicB family nuclease|nr:MAG: HicB family protein [Gammaproteobacteria bacterium HGW-Gammaproteobacteria-4]